MRKSVWVFSVITAGLLGVVAYQAIRLRQMGAQIAILSRKAERIDSRPANLPPSSKTALATELDAALREIRSLRQEIAGTKKESSGIAERVEALKEVLRRLPEQQIPQLAYASDSDWYAAVDGKLETADDYRIALARIRASAEEKFAKVLQPVLRAYLDANGGTFPHEAIQLQPYFGEPVEPAALQHYKVVRASEIKSVQLGGEWVITQASVVDSEYDSHIVIGPRGSGAYSNRSLK
jgi:hypothetical protein